MLDLPEGYRFERDPDPPRLIAPNGKVVAHFGTGWSPAEVEREAAVHEQKVEAAIRELERLLGRPHE